MVYVISAHLANYNTCLLIIRIYAYIWKEIGKVQNMVPARSAFYFSKANDGDYTNEGNKSQLPVAKSGYCLKSQLLKYFLGGKKIDHIF